MENESVNVWVPRVAGVIATFIVGKVQEQFKTTLDPATLTTIMIGVYALTHRFVSKFTNPGDAASSHLASLEKAQTVELKSAPHIPDTGI